MTVTDQMVERGAKHLAGLELWQTWDEMSPSNREEYRRVVRAVLLEAVQGLEVESPDA